MSLRSACVLAMVGLAMPAQAAPDEGRGRIVVLDLQAEKGVEAGTARLLTDLLLTRMGAAQGWEIVGQRDLATMLDFERQKDLLACSDEDSCLVELAGALGADLLLSGVVGKLGRELVVTSKLLDAEQGSARERCTRRVTGGEEALADAVSSCAQAFLAALGERAASDAVDAPAAPPSGVDEAAPAPAEQEGIFEQWWLWTTVGVVVAGGVAAAVVLAREAPEHQLRVELPAPEGTP